MHVTADPAVTGRRSRGRPRRAWILAFVAVPALYAIVAWALFPGSPAPFLDRVAELRAAGYVVTYEDRVGPAPPEEINAAPELLAAWEGLLAQEGPQSSWTVTGPWDYKAEDPWHETAPAERLADLAGFLDRARPFFDRVDAALSRDRMWVAVTPDEHGNRAEPVTSVVRRVEGVLEARAAADPSARGRLASCATRLRLANRVEVSSTLDGLYAATMQTRGIRDLRRLIDRRLVPPSEARAACDRHLRTSFAQAFPRATRGDIVRLAESYDSFLRGAPDPLGLFRAPPRGIDTLQRWFRDGADSLGPEQVSDLLGPSGRSRPSIRPAARRGSRKWKRASPGHPCGPPGRGP